MKARLLKFGVPGALIVAALAAALFYGGFGHAGADAPGYRLAGVGRGPMSSTVAASGTLIAVVTVDVGTQVSGMIKTLHADFNSEVKANQVIARIDSAPFEAKLSQAEADLAVERARVAIQQAALIEAEADLEGARAALTEARENLRRKRSLLARRVAPSSAVDTALAAHQQAESRVKAGVARIARQKAEIQLARAQVLVKDSTVKQRRLDLDYTYIRSPVDGVVIRRNVDAGQTVAASLQAPVLFRIAQDLSRMQVEVSVDEADIGQVQVGQKVNFTVDSFPDRNFEGRVHQVRKAGTEVSNVVTYTVVVTADNEEQRLLPGMTANVTIVISERPDALKVPNAALRFRPPGAKAPATPAARAEDRRARAERRLRRMTERLRLSVEQEKSVRDIFADTGRRIRALRQQGGSREERARIAAKLRAASVPRIEAVLTEVQRAEYRKMRASRDSNPRRRGQVWVLDGSGRPEAVPVVYGISDGAQSEIVSGALKPGQKVIVGIAEPAAARRTRLRFGF